MRNKRITNLRAFAIFIVVLGHSIILYSSQWNIYQTTVQSMSLDYLKKIINLFQMPLYFSLGGYLFYNAQEKKYNFVSFIRKKFLRVIIPYPLNAILWLIPIRCFVKYPGYINMSFGQILKRTFVDGDCGHLWFLPALFIIFMVMYFACKYVYKQDSNIIYMLIGVISIGILYIAEKMPFYHVIDNAMLYLFWFYLGFLLNKYENMLILNRKRLTIALCIIAVATYLLNKQQGLFFFEFVCSLSIVTLLYCVVPNKSNRCIESIDRNSFGIYLFHSPLIYFTYTYIPNASPVVVVFVNLVCFGVVAYAITSLFKRSFLKVLIGE